MDAKQLREMRDMVRGNMPAGQPSGDALEVVDKAGNKELRRLNENLAKLAQAPRVTRPGRSDTPKQTDQENQTTLRRIFEGLQEFKEGLTTKSTFDPKAITDKFEKAFRGTAPRVVSSAKLRPAGKTDNKMIDPDKLVSTLQDNNKVLVKEIVKMRKELTDLKNGLLNPKTSKLLAGGLEPTKRQITPTGEASGNGLLSGLGGLFNGFLSALGSLLGGLGLGKLLGIPDRIRPGPGAPGRPTPGKTPTEAPRKTPPRPQPRPPASIPPSVPVPDDGKAPKTEPKPVPDDGKAPKTEPKPVPDDGKAPKVEPKPKPTTLPEPVPTTKDKEKKTPKKAPGRFGKLLKGGLNLLKGAGPLGALVTAGVAGYEGATGAMEAEQVLGIEGREATLGERVSAGLGSVASSLTFGLAGSREDLSKGVKNLIGAGPKVEPTLKEEFSAYRLKEKDPEAFKQYQDRIQELVKENSKKQGADADVMKVLAESRVQAQKEFEGKAREVGAMIKSDASAPSAVQFQPKAAPQVGAAVNNMSVENAGLKQQPASPSVAQPIVSNTVNNNTSQTVMPASPAPRNHTSAIERYLDKIR